MKKVRMHNHETFLINAEIVHGDDYTYLEKYTKSKIKMKIRCNECDQIFWKSPSDHIHTRQGCVKCTKRRVADALRDDTPTYINKLSQREDGGKYYGYGRVNYRGMAQLITIYCPHCDVYFEQNAGNHLYGNAGCNSCGYIASGIKLRHDTPTYLSKLIKRADKGLYFGYDEVHYTGKEYLISIYCTRCDSYFEQRAGDHLHKNCGCTNCEWKMSIGARRIKKYLEDSHIEFCSEKRYNSCRYKNTLPFDFHLPKMNILIEFDGKQHFTDYKWGGVKGLRDRQRNDGIKDQWCLDNNIPLIRIKYNVSNIEEYLEQELDKIINQ